MRAPRTAALIAAACCGVCAGGGPARLPDPAAEDVAGFEEGSSASLTLTEAEERAVATSPALAALAADVAAARWECVQAGLPPNPTVGYVANEIGNEGAAGQQGAFIGQQFIRGGKLRYAQAVAAKEARLREQRLAVERRRVLTDVRTTYFETHLAQLEIDLATELVMLSRRGAETSRRLLAAGEGRKTDLLQAEVESQRAEATRRQATVRRDAAWRQLAALTGLPPDAPARVEGNLRALVDQPPWEALAGTIAATSPEVAARVAAIERARCAVALERSQAVPDVTAQVAVQYDDGTDDTITSVQLGLPLVLWNRNQGGIGRAQAELVAARRRLAMTEQTLERSLAEAYGRYERARTQAETLSAEVLPRAEESLELATEGYAAGEVSFLELLTVQRTFFEVSLERIALLRQVSEAAQLLDGALLAGSGALD